MFLFYHAQSIPPIIVDRTNRSPLGNTKSASAPQPSLNALTGRELEVLKEIAHGKDNTTIAAKLNLSVKTVKTHVSNILSKLYLSDRTQAAVYALKQRIVPLDE